MIDPPISPSGSFLHIDTPRFNKQECTEQTLFGRMQNTFNRMLHLRQTWSLTVYNGSANLFYSTVESKPRQIVQCNEWKNVYPTLNILPCEAAHIGLILHPYVKTLAQSIKKIVMESISFPNDIKHVKQRGCY